MADRVTDLPDRWLRGLTQARVGLGRVGQGVPTAALLDCQLAAARARDAVQATLDVDALASALGLPAIIVSSAADGHRTYLQRPDLGRRLDPADRPLLQPGAWDLAIVIGDGLSARAVAAHAAPVVRALVDRLPGWQVAPPVIALRARVALGDEIGAALGTRLVVVLIGERPGMSAPDSLGAYLTFDPRPGCVDSMRNCVSNIRPPHGLGHDEAADRIAWLLHEARRRGESGTALKEAANAPRLTQ
jgi:ethanolamine ammonia-lyase small subunit